MKRSDRRRFGSFSLGLDKTIHGELTIESKATSLYLHDQDFFATNNIPHRCIKGLLHDLTHVTLIDCVAPRSPGSFSRGTEGYFYAKVFPHFVVEGDRYIDPESPDIQEVSFLLDDFPQLFEDPEAIDFVLTGARPIVDQILKKQKPDHFIETGDDATLIYFTGKTDVSTADTVYGTVAIRRGSGLSFNGSRSAALRNKITCSIRFNETLIFRESISRALTLINYLGMLAGRPQNLLSLSVETGSKNTDITPLKVHWSYAPQRDVSNASTEPNSFDVLLDGVRDPGQFGLVLKHWLIRHEEWQAARWRFFRAFDKQRYYDPDRLIGAANMFDILPPSAVPLEAPLTQDLECARNKARALFRELPKSLERDSILNDLGRLGKSHLKHKIRHRAQRVIAASTESFPELLMVTDEAVNCRNYYVHGTPGRFDYERNFDMVTFFTDTLEFLFATSDLLEAGWDMRSWIIRGTTASHPFGRYIANYQYALKHLNGLLQRAPQT